MVDSNGIKSSACDVEDQTEPGFAQARQKNGFRSPVRENQNKTHKAGNGYTRTDDVTWEQRKTRMDCAIEWLKSEMNFLRIYDKLIEAQFMGVQSRIEELKREREEVRRRRRSVSLDTELDEEEVYWEDWEIKEFEDTCQHGLSLDSRLTAVSREIRNVECRQKNQPKNQNKEQLDQKQLSRETNGTRVTLPRKESSFNS